MFTKFSVPDLQVIGEKFGLNIPNDLKSSSMSISRGMSTFTITQKDNVFRLHSMKWGLLPSWSKRSKDGVTVAPYDSIDQKKLFRKLISSSRCIVPASSFEIKFENYFDGTKTTKEFAYENGDLMTFAAIYDVQKHILHPTIYSFAILTNHYSTIDLPSYAKIPLIITGKSEKFWLSKKEYIPDEILNNVTQNNRPNLKLINMIEERIDKKRFQSEQRNKPQAEITL
ncbi:MAG: SOS response-associated peptidase family protein [Patescibacteria group bacterium]